MNYEIFIDTDSIHVGDIWDITIETNISSCDILVVIITHASLESPHLEKEVLQSTHFDLTRPLLLLLFKSSYAVSM